MISKSKFYLNYIVKTSLVLIVLFSISASSSKMEAVSTNENINRSVDLSTMAIYINKEEEEKANEEALQKYLWGSLDSYTGDLTGYGANCPACSVCTV